MIQGYSLSSMQIVLIIIFGVSRFNKDFLLFQPQLTFFGEIPLRLPCPYIISFVHLLHDITLHNATNGALCILHGNHVCGLSDAIFYQVFLLQLYNIR